MLSILIISNRGEGYGLSKRLAQEGHNVKYWSNYPLQRPGVQNELGWKAVNRYEPHIEAADLVIFPAPGFGSLAVEMGAGGKLVIGGIFQDRLDTDVLRALATLLDKEVSTNTGSSSVYLSGLFARGRLVESWVSQCYNRLLDNDRGPLGLSQGCATVSVDIDILKPVEELVQSFQYSGPLAVEMNMRDQVVDAYTNMSGDWWFSYLAGIRGNLGSKLFNLAQGLWSPGLRTYSGAVKLSRMDNTELNLNQGAVKHFFPVDSHQILGYVTSSGDSLREVRRRLYRTINNIAPVEILYRTDIGNNLLIPEEGEPNGR